MVRLMDLLSQLCAMHLKQTHFIKIKVFYAVTPCRLVFTDVSDDLSQELFLTLEDGTNRLSRNFGKELPLLAA